MAGSRLNTVLKHVRKLVAAHDLDALADQRLVQRFAEEGDTASFEALVRRHGPMVLRVARQVLRHLQDAEDVFQATFLVLARKAPTIRRRASVASWLHGVAYHLAVQTRAAATRQRARERAREPAASVELPAEVTWMELQCHLHEELSRLSDAYRAPLILCYLESKTQDEAARQLGWSVGTLRRRLEAGRKLLHARLTRRGLSLPAALLAAGLSGYEAEAAVTGTLVMSTVEGGCAFAAGKSLVGGGILVRAVALAESGLRQMFLAKLKTVALVLALLSMTAGGAGVLSHHAATATPPDEKPVGRPQPPAGKSAARPEQRPRTDVYGDPLPPEAVARLGSTRWCLDADLAHFMIASQDGKKLCSANPVTGVSIWDLATGRFLGTIATGAKSRRTSAPVAALPGAAPAKEGTSLAPPPEPRASAVALSPDGSTAAIGEFDGSVRVLDLLTGKEKQRCRGHTGALQEAALSTEGRVLATRSADRSLRIWDVATGKQLRHLPIHAESPDQIRRVELALAPDGKTVAWVGADQDAAGKPLRDRLIHVYDVDTGRETHRLEKHRGWRRRLGFSPDSRKLVSTSDDGPGQVWDVRSGAMICELPFWRTADLSAPAFSPDSKALAHTVGADALRLIDAQTGKEIWKAPRLGTSTIDDVFAFTTDGKTLIVSSHVLGQVLVRYDVATGKRLALDNSSKGFQAIAFSPDEGTVCTLGGDGVVRSWVAATGKQASESEVLGSQGGVFSSDGRRLIALRNGIHLYDIPGSKERWHIPSDESMLYSTQAFSGDGRRLALVGTGMTGQRWYTDLLVLETAAGKKLRQLKGIPEYLEAVSFDSSGSKLWAHARSNYSEGGPLHSWDVATGRMRTLKLPPHWSSVAMSADRKTVAVPLQDWSAIHLIEIATGRKRLAIPPSDTWPSPLGFSPDGRLFLVGDKDGSLRFYDALSGRFLARRPGHRGTITGWAFSASGRKMATFSLGDRTALLWTMDGVSPQSARKTVLSESALSVAWSDLAGVDAVKAYAVIATLVQAPDRSLPWICKHIRPAGEIEPDRVRQLIADLDSPQFAVRQKASRELEKYGVRIESALRKALARGPSVEVRLRLTRLLSRLEEVESDPWQLQTLRSIEVLEHIGSAAAADALQTLADGAPEARFTQEAREALERVRRCLESHK